MSFSTIWPIYTDVTITCRLNDIWHIYFRPNDVAWKKYNNIDTKVVRRLRAKNLKRRLIDATPFVYSELEAAISSLKSNNLYSSGTKKTTISRWGCDVLIAERPVIATVTVLDLATFATDGITRGARKLMGDNLKLVGAEFSTLGFWWCACIYLCLRTPTSIVENSAQV
jgi:hypothetical protein